MSMCWRRSGARVKTTLSSHTSPRKPKSPELKVSTLAVCVLVTLRAALIWLFIASITPLPRASGVVAMRMALSRLRGPSKSGDEALRCAPMRITGLSDLTVRSSQ
ncbi:hypothetical protein D9M68_747720 [compost metagenome]